ncbi:MAG: hypothetical protein LH613_17460, partial [Chamaesiphon sp.]|nr:hypothetical protein [Chamaesiphon sp.]
MKLTVIVHEAILQGRGFSFAKRLLGTRRYANGEKRSLSPTKIDRDLIYLIHKLHFEQIDDRSRRFQWC